MRDAAGLEEGAKVSRGVFARQIAAVQGVAQHGPDALASENRVELLYSGDLVLRHRGADLIDLDADMIDAQPPRGVGQSKQIIAAHLPAVEEDEELAERHSDQD